MSIVHQGIVVIGGGAAPDQHNLVGVACITEDNGIIGIHLCLVSDLDGAVGVAGVDHIGCGVHGLAGVDLIQTCGSHLDPHHGLASGSSAVIDSELTVSLGPLGDPLGAGSIGVEFQNYIALQVGDTFGQGVNKAVFFEVGAGAGDAGKSTGDDVVDDITSGGGAGMGIAVSQFLGTLVLAGVILVLLELLFERRNASEVLREADHIIDPAGAAIGGIGARNTGHRYTEEETITGRGHMFGYQSLATQIETQLQIGYGGLAVAVGQGHGDAAVCLDIGFHSILYDSCVGLQSCVQGIDQHIGLVVELGGVQLVSLVRVLIAASAVLQTDGFQELRALDLVDAIQYFHMVGGGIVIGRLGKLDDVRDLQDGEFHTGDRVTVALFAVAQIRGVVVVTVTFSISLISSAFSTVKFL